MTCSNCRDDRGNPSGLIYVQRKDDKTRFIFRCNCLSGTSFTHYEYYNHRSVIYEPIFTKDEIQKAKDIIKSSKDLRQALDRSFTKGSPAPDFLSSMDVSREAVEIEREMSNVIPFRPCDLPSEDICPI